MRDEAAPPSALFPLALQFLTRLPVPAARNFSPARLAEATRWFPAVGLIVGGIGAAVYLLAGLVFPPGFSAIIALAATALATGALHEDGLADLADGLGGGRTRTGALEIMRDSRIGSYGALALGFTLAAQAVALAALPPLWAAAGLVAGHALSRLAMVAVMASAPYARMTGAGGFAAAGISRRAQIIAAVTGVLALAALGIATQPAAALTAAALAAASALALRHLLVARLSGWTGDGLGAIQQAAFLAILGGLLAWV